MGDVPRRVEKAYAGMIRPIATWGAELGWRGQKAWEKDFSRLQYQALRKATGEVQGTSAEKVNKIAGVESADIHMDNNQVRFVARCVEDPTKVRDMLPVGFGDAGGVLSMMNWQRRAKDADGTTMAHSGSIQKKKKTSSCQP